MLGLVPEKPPSRLADRRGQDRAEPGGELRVGTTSKLRELLASDDQRLLDHIGGIEPLAKPGIDLDPGQ